MAELPDVRLSRRFDTARVSKDGLYSQYCMGDNVTVETPEGV